MMRVPIWATTFALVAGGALAAPSLDAPIRDPQPVERPTLFEDSIWEEFVLPVEEVVAAEGVQIARKARGGGGKRGGAKSKNRGGFKNGNDRIDSPRRRDALKREHSRCRLFVCRCNGPLF